MDTDSIITHARSRFDHAVSRRTLQEKYEAKMLFAYNEGMWRAGPELLTLLQAIPVEDSAVILDLYQTPIKINVLELQHLAFDRWQEQMNAWLLEFHELQSKR